MSLYVGAFVFEESLGLASPSGEELAPERVVDMIGSCFRSPPAEGFPNTFAVLEHLTAGDLDERFEFGLDVLVRGLAATREQRHEPARLLGRVVLRGRLEPGHVGHRHHGRADTEVEAFF